MRSCHSLAQTRLCGARPRHWNTSHGFTLTELMVTLAVAAILVAVAAPSFRPLVQSNRMATQTNELLTALNLARSEAAMRGQQVSVCASTDGSSCANSTNWATGWVVFTDGSGAAGVVDASDQLLRSWEALQGSSVLTGDTGFIQYLPTGAAAAVASFQLSIPDGTGPSAPRNVCVTGPGRAVATENPC